MYAQCEVYACMYTPESKLFINKTTKKSHGDKNLIRAFYVCILLNGYHTRVYEQSTKIMLLCNVVIYSALDIALVSVTYHVKHKTYWD